VKNARGRLGALRDEDGREDEGRKQISTPARVPPTTLCSAGRQRRRAGACGLSFSVGKEAKSLTAILFPCLTAFATAALCLMIAFWDVSGAGWASPCVTRLVRIRSRLGRRRCALLMNMTRFPAVSLATSSARACCRSSCARMAVSHSPGLASARAVPNSALSRKVIFARAPENGIMTCAASPSSVSLRMCDHTYSFGSATAGRGEVGPSASSSEPQSDRPSPQRPPQDVAPPARAPSH
jgi:hypothetical protein